MASSSPFDYLQNMYDNAKQQLQSMEPSIFSAPPSQTPPISQNDYDQALEPVAQFASNVGNAAGATIGMPPLMQFGGIAAGIADQFNKANPTGALGSPVGSEAGMNSLPLSTLIELAQRDTQNALSGPTIHDIINARNTLYHATGNVNATGILNSGVIKPGSGDQFSGVAMSRTPVSPEKTRQLRFEVDPNAIPPAIPTADAGYGKTSPTSSPSWWEVFKNLSGGQFKQMVKEAGHKDPNFNTSMTSLNDSSMTEMGQLADTPTFYKQMKKLQGDGSVNPSFEFETRTQGGKVPVSAIKQAIIGTPGTSYDKDPMEIYKNLLLSKNPVPATLLKIKDVPLARVIANKFLSQQVTKKFLSNSDVPAPTFQQNSPINALEEDPDLLKKSISFMNSVGK